MTEGMELIIGKDGVCRERKEPWGVFECETEQDFHFLECAIEFYKKHQWIPVTERMPDIAGMPVLVVAENTYGHKRVVQAFTNYECPVEFETNNKEFDMVWKTAWKVTHWMPLPEPPSDEDAERETSEVYGEWIDSHVPGSALSECSLCHYDCGAYTMKFCPMCGHPMKWNGGTKQSVSEDRE